MKSSIQPKPFNSRLIVVQGCPIMKKLQKLQRSLSARIKMASTNNTDVPRGHFVVYVGERYKRFVIPISYLNHPLFRDLLDCAEEEFGFNHPKGGLTIPCTEDYFINLTSSLGYS